MTTNNPINPRLDLTDVTSDPVGCGHCGRLFKTEHQRALHLGNTHPDDLTPRERDEFEAAEAAESDELFLFHMKVIVALGGLYSSFVILYMVLAQGF